MKNIILILVLICGNSALSVAQAFVENLRMYECVKTIAIESVVGVNSISIPEAPYSNKVKERHVQIFHENIGNKINNLIIRLKNNENHQSLTEVYGINSFEAKLTEFECFSSVPHVVYSSGMPNLHVTNAYYVDTFDGKHNPYDCSSGLGKFRLSLKTEKKRRYFVAAGIKDCIFLTGFNVNTKASFNIHINYSMFADDNARDFATFEPTLKKSLGLIRGDALDNNMLQITLISSYLGTGMKALWTMMNDMGYMENVRLSVDFKTSSKDGYVPESFIIRTVGAAGIANINGNDSYVAWTRPVSVYIKSLIGLTAPVKDIIFDAETGEHFQV